MSTTSSSSPETPTRPGSPAAGMFDNHRTPGPAQTTPSAAPSAETNDEALNTDAQATSSADESPGFSSFPERHVPLAAHTRSSVKSQMHGAFTLDLNRARIIKRLERENRDRRSQNEAKRLKDVENPYFRFVHDEFERKRKGYEKELRDQSKNLNSAKASIAVLQETLESAYDDIDVLSQPSKREVKDAEAQTEVTGSSGVEAVTLAATVESGTLTEPVLSSAGRSDAATLTDAASQADAAIQTDAATQGNAGVGTSSTPPWTSEHRDRLIEQLFDYFRTNCNAGEQYLTRSHIEECLSATCTLSGFCQAMLFNGIKFKPEELARALFHAGSITEEEIQNVQGVGRIDGTVGVLRQQIRALRLQLGEQLVKLQEQKDEYEAELIARRLDDSEAIENLRKELDKCQKHGEGQRMVNEELQEQLELRKALHTSSQEEVDRRSSVCQELQAKIDILTQQLDEAKTIIKNLEHVLDRTNGGAIKELQDQLFECRKHGAEKQRKIEELERSLQSAVRASAEAKNSANSFLARLKECRDRNTVLEKERSTRDQSLRVANDTLEDLTGLRQAPQAREDDLGELRENLARAERNLQTYREGAEQLHDMNRNLEAEKRRLEADNAMLRGAREAPTPAVMESRLVPSLPTDAVARHRYGIRDDQERRDTIAAIKRRQAAAKKADEEEYQRRRADRHSRWFDAFGYVPKARLHR